MDKLKNWVFDRTAERTSWDGAVPNRWRYCNDTYTNKFNWLGHDSIWCLDYLEKED